jgi:hypothetical protein
MYVMYDIDCITFMTSYILRVKLFYTISKSTHYTDVCAGLSQETNQQIAETVL